MTRVTSVMVQPGELHSGSHGHLQMYGLKITASQTIAPHAGAVAVPDDELSLELLLLLLSSDDDESSDDDDDELSSLLLLVSLESFDEVSEEPSGFLRFFLGSDLAPGSSLPFLASPGSSSDAPRKRGLYCECMRHCHFSSYAAGQLVREKQAIQILNVPKLL